MLDADSTPTFFLFGRIVHASFVSSLFILTFIPSFIPSMLISRIPARGRMGKRPAVKQVCSEVGLVLCLHVAGVRALL